MASFQNFKYQEEPIIKGLLEGKVNRNPAKLVPKLLLINNLKMAGTEIRARAFLDTIVHRN